MSHSWYDTWWWKWLYVYILLLCYWDIQSLDWSVNLYWFLLMSLPLELFQYSDQSLPYQISWHPDHSKGSVEPSLSNLLSLEWLNKAVSKYTEEAAINNVATASWWTFCNTSYLGMNFLGLVLPMTFVILGEMQHNDYKNDLAVMRIH